MLINLINYSIWDKSLISDKIPIIITTYHKRATFEKCYSLLSKHNKNPIYIIDNSNGNLDESLDEIKNKNVKIIKNSKNIGKAASIQENYKNLILEYQWFISMDPDVLVSNDDIDILLKNANQLLHSGYPISIIAPIINDGNCKKDQLQSRKLDMHKWGSMHEITDGLYINEFIAGCLILINTNFFVKNNGFKNKQLYGGDDGELCKNSLKDNLVSIIDTNVELLHCREEEPEEYKQWKIKHIKEKHLQKGFWDL